METSALTATCLAVLGAMLGSFLNVCIWRLPRGESIVLPASHCTSCGARIGWYDNIPVLSYIILRGRCRRCGERFSIRYPMVELASAGLAVAAYLDAGLGLDLLEHLCLLYLLLAIGVADARTYTIPDILSLGGLALGLLLSFLPGGITPLQSLIGALAGGGLLLLVTLAGEWVFKREAMGGGDVKMLAMIGAFLGWPGVVLTIFLGSLAGSLIYGFINYVLRRERLVPFGVFMAVGAAVHVFFGPELIGWYISTFILPSP